ncbi:MAG: helix-turn-helix transcriptional regulator [Kiloniellaceae bacterium]
MARKISKKGEAGNVVTVTARSTAPRTSSGRFGPVSKDAGRPVTSMIGQIGSSLDQAQAEIDKARQMLAQLATAENAEDAEDAASVAHVRGLLASGAEEVIPAEVVKRLDAGESPVRVFREWRGMTQGQLAAAIEVDQSFISKIEAGTKHPTAANLGRLARALKVDADLLLPDED